MGKTPESGGISVTRSWHYRRTKSIAKPESSGGLLSLYIAVVASIAFYYLFQ